MSHPMANSKIDNCVKSSRVDHILFINFTMSHSTIRVATPHPSRISEKFYSVKNKITNKS